MPELKPAYLIHGDDHGSVVERRASLRSLLEDEGGTGAVEVLEGENSTPGNLALALQTLTISIGRRVLIVDGVERWKQAEVEQQLVDAMREIPPQTTVAMFAREESRLKAPTALHQVVERAGGQIIPQMAVKPWELPRWARERAARLGISLDTAAAKALVAQVGDRQQRLIRELEKLALELDLIPGEKPVVIAAEQIELRASHSSVSQTYLLADLLLRGKRAQAVRAFLRLREQGERISGMVYLIGQRFRDALSVSVQLQAGRPMAEIKRTLRMPPRAAERFLADVSSSEPERLRAAIGALADLELDTRGGAPVSDWRTGESGLSEDTRAVRAIELIAG